jgi:hypothetical protein
MDLFDFFVQAIDVGEGHRSAGLTPRPSDDQQGRDDQADLDAAPHIAEPTLKHVSFLGDGLPQN